MNNIKAYFKKPSMPFDQILLLGICMFGLIIVIEANDGVIGFIDTVGRALIMTIVIALMVQLFRLGYEVINE